MNDTKDTYTVVREIDIPAPPEKVRGALADFHEWQRWSPWEGLDPAMTRTYSGAESGVGAVYEWQGNRKAGAGRMEITDVSPDTVVIALTFTRPFKSANTTTFSLKPQADGTHVSWTMVGPKTWMTKLMGIVTSMDKLVGKDFEKGLRQLRAYVAG